MACSSYAARGRELELPHHRKLVSDSTCRPPHLVGPIAPGTLADGALILFAAALVMLFCSGKREPEPIL